MATSRKAIWRRALVLLAFVLAGQMFLTPGASASEPCPSFYRVQRGDTLFAVARRFGVSVTDIVQANGICNPNLIIAGQCLVIPCPKACPTPPKKDTSKTCVTTSTSCVTTTASCVPCKPKDCIHIVQRGETLSSIAQCFGTTVAVLQKLNCICNPNLIFVGQRLQVCIS